MNGDEQVRGQSVVPLRTILTDFLNLVETYEARRNGGLDSYDSEFQELKQFSENLKNDPDHVCREGERTVNRKKNRYKDILPYDYTRVILSDYGDVPGCDYINANYIKGASGSSAYIASQGPLPHTVNDFWRMVVECEVQVIVMACNEQESGKHKCENYWVEEDGVEREFGEVTVWLKKCRQVCPDFLVRTMRIKFTNAAGEKEERNVCQFHYSAWPDHGVPTRVRPLLDMVRLIRDRQTSETLPVLVHCSAGCGRTGTICAIDYVWGLLRLGRLTQDFSLFTLVREMRKQRIAMVQTKDQYILVHRAVKELFQEQLKIIDSHPYANVDENGLPLNFIPNEPAYETLDSVHTRIPTLNTDNAKDGSRFSGSYSGNVNNSNLSNSSTGENVKAASGSKISTPPLTTSSTEMVSQSEPPALPSKLNVSDVLSKSTKDKNKSTERNKCEDKPLSEIDQIEVCVSDKKNNTGSESDQAKTPSALRSALLRKPSIIKLRSLFEKHTKEDKHKKPGQLSRAKSDVSTRFYSFNNFLSVETDNHPKENQKNVEEKNHQFNLVSSSNSSRNSSQIKMKKPPILTKPTIPIKRSKSLKIPPETAIAPSSRESSANSKKHTESHSKQSSVTSSNSSTSPSMPGNPIKVCVKQVEIPKLQAVVSKSSKAESHSTKNHEYDYDIDNRSHLRQKPINPIDLQFKIEHSQKSGSPVKSGLTGQSNMEECVNIKIPVPPVRGHSVKDHNYTNVALQSRTEKSSKPKKFVEMEDLQRFAKEPTYSKLKKCDTVNPRLLSSSLGFASKQDKTLLARSQSHVWQPDKTSLPVRIFSSENIHKSSQLGKQDDMRESSRRDSTENSTSTYANKLSFTDKEDSGIFIQAINPDVSVTTGNNMDSLTKSIDLELSLSGEQILTSATKHVIRRRVPKTNPYANYPACITGSNSKFPQKISQPAENGFSSVIHENERGASSKDVIPNLKSVNGGSVGNSSDSSSNTGTPRNSLPSTPTQSVDLLYPQLHRGSSSRSSALQNVTRSNGVHLINAPKSILKEPLTSVESDDNPDSTRIATAMNCGSQIPKINTIRIAVGVRERRNSFRQAVWKEAQPSNSFYQPKDEILDLDDHKGLILREGSGHVGRFNKIDANVNGIMEVPKSNRNYEPIWPESNIDYSIIPTSNSMKYNHQTSDQSREDRGESSVFGKSIGFSGNTTLNHGLNKNKETMNFQNKVGEIRVMLAELNAPANKGEGISSLKQHRSLRAPTRSQYQQGVSCFNFKKPSSCESVMEQLQKEDDQRCLLASNYNETTSCTPVSQNQEMQSSKDFPPTFSRDRQVNDYVTLRQCHTMENSRGCEPQKTFDYFAQEFHPPSTPAGSLQSQTPVPPPRTKKNHCNVPKGLESVRPYDKAEECPRNMFHLDANNSATDSVSSCVRQGQDKQVSTGFGRNDDSVLVNDSLSLSNEFPNASGTSPKAIIKALGLFQAKAANVRSRFANWAEAKERNPSKRTFVNSNGVCKNSTTTSNEIPFQQPSQHTAIPGSSNHIMAGSVTRSKHQYL